MNNSNVNSGSYQSTSWNLWRIVFTSCGRGNVLWAVLPYCILNCSLLGLVKWWESVEGNHEIGFSPTGHGLLTLLISFLVISKVNIAYDRFRLARHHSGVAFMELRELHQFILMISNSLQQQLLMDSAAMQREEDEEEIEQEQREKQNIKEQIQQSAHASFSVPTRPLQSVAAGKQTTTTAMPDPGISTAESFAIIDRWREDCSCQIYTLLDATQRAVQNKKLASHLARNTQNHSHEFSSSFFNYHRHEDTNATFKQEDDPLVLIQVLRMHLYTGLAMFHASHLQLLERVNWISKCTAFANSFRILLELASTPLPHTLVAMGRTFLFVWVFTMPLVLREGGPFDNVTTAMVFLFFLTYGFMGLEMVGMKLSEPFGEVTRSQYDDDAAHDADPDTVQMSALRQATIVGIENDAKAVKLHYDYTKTAYSSLSQRRLQFRQLKPALGSSKRRFSHMYRGVQDRYEVNDSNNSNIVIDRSDPSMGIDHTVSAGSLQ